MNDHLFSIAVVPRRTVSLPPAARPEPVPLIRIGGQTEPALVWLHARELPTRLVLEVPQPSGAIEIVGRFHAASDTPGFAWCDVPCGLPLAPFEVRVSAVGVCQVIDIPTETRQEFQRHLGFAVGEILSRLGSASFSLRPLLADDYGREFTFDVDIEIEQPETRYREREDTPVPQWAGFLRRLLTPLGRHGYCDVTRGPPPEPNPQHFVHRPILHVVFRDPRQCVRTGPPTLVSGPSQHEATRGAAAYCGATSSGAEFSCFQVWTTDLLQVRPLLHRVQEPLAALTQHPMTARCAFDGSGLCVLGTATQFGTVSVVEWCSLVLHVSDALG